MPTEGYAMLCIGKEVMRWSKPERGDKNEVYKQLSNDLASVITKGENISCRYYRGLSITKEDF
jgi:hypothetical protein